MESKQEKTLEWLRKIKQFSQEENMPVRILDSIEECMEQTGKPEPDWETVTGKIEEILESISDKTVGEVSEDIVVENEINNISLDEVKTYVTQALDRGHDENRMSINSFADRQNLIVQKCYRKICEISFTKAHLKEIKSGGRYLQFFETIKYEYERDFVGIGKALVENIGNNCANMMEHIRSMFQNIGGRKLGIGNKEFYNFYEDKKEHIDNKFLNEVETMDFNGDTIMDFSRKTRTMIDLIKKRNKRKQRFFSLLPILILLMLFLVRGILSSVQMYNDYKAVSNEIEKLEQTIESENTTEDSLQKTINVAGDTIDVVKEISDIFSENETTSSTVFINILSIENIIAVVVFLVIAYVAYVMFLTHKYKEKMLNQCQDYLQMECEQFEKDNSLGDHGQFEKMVDEYEQEYVHIMDNIFRGSKLDSFSEESERKATFSQLFEEWNKIKYQ